MAKAKYKRQKDGRFQAKVWDGTYNEDGTKHRQPIYSTKSSGDLEKKVNKMKREVEEGNKVQHTDYTFVEYALYWLKTYKAVKSKATKNMYNNIIEKHLYILDGLPLSMLRHSHIQEVINEAKEMPRTCQQIELTAKQIIAAAIQDHYISEDDYSRFQKFEKPKYTPTEKRALYPEEIEAIENADFTPREKAFVYLIYGCGFRRGETIALTTFDIKPKKKVISINKAIAFDGNNPYIKPPKTENGYRDTTVPGYALEFLQGYIKTLDGPNLFTTKAGGLMTKSAYDKMWASIVRKMNAAAGGTKDLQVIHGLTAHIFRHNYCTNLCYQVPKISIKKIAQLMGDTEKMVIEVYNHIMEEKEDPEAVVNEALKLRS